MQIVQQCSPLKPGPVSRSTPRSGVPGGPTGTREAAAARTVTAAAPCRAGAGEGAPRRPPSPTCTLPRTAQRLQRAANGRAAGGALRGARANERAGPRRGRDRAPTTLGLSAALITFSEGGEGSLRPGPPPPPPPPPLRAGPRRCHKMFDGCLLSLVFPCLLLWGLDAGTGSASILRVPVPGGADSPRTWRPPVGTGRAADPLRGRSPALQHGSLQAPAFSFPVLSLLL